MVFYQSRFQLFNSPLESKLRQEQINCADIFVGIKLNSTEYRVIIFNATEYYHLQSADYNRIIISEWVKRAELKRSSPIVYHIAD